jgi:hypothetical protein
MILKLENHYLSFKYNLEWGMYKNRCFVWIQNGYKFKKYVRSTSFVSYYKTLIFHTETKRIQIQEMRQKYSLFLIIESTSGVFLKFVSV